MLNGNYTTGVLHRNQNYLTTIKFDHPWNMTNWKPPYLWVYIFVQNTFTKLNYIKVPREIICLMKWLQKLFCIMLCGNRRNLTNGMFTETFSHIPSGKLPNKCFLNKYLNQIRCSLLERTILWCFIWGMIFKKSLPIRCITFIIL